MFRNFYLCTALAVVVFTSAAQAQHFDVFVARPASGNQTVFGGIDVDTQAITLGTRVFEAEVEELPPANIFFGDAPGFNHPDDNVPLPAGVNSLVEGDDILVRQLDLTVGGVTGPVFFWDGVGPVSFVPPSNATFDIATPMPPNPSIGLAGVDGSFDDHPLFELSNNGSLPAPGIYLGSLEVEVDGLAPSDQLFLVLGTEGLITAEFLGIDQTEFDMLTLSLIHI